MFKYALGGIVLSTAMHSAALSLGDSSGQAIIGRPLDLQVRSSSPLADIESAGCLLAEVRYGDSVLPAGSVSLSVQAAGSGALIRVRSSVPVNEPVVSVRLQTGCAADRFTRNYTLLADLDPTLAPSASVAALPLVVSPRAEALAPATPATPAAAMPALAMQPPASSFNAPGSVPGTAASPSPAAPPAPPTAPAALPAPAAPASGARSPSAPAAAPAARPAARPAPAPRAAPRPAPAPAPRPPAADRKVAAPAPSPAPKAAAPAAPPPVASGARLKLDPVDLSPGSNPGLKLNTELQTPPAGSEADRKAAAELWAALNTPPEKAAEDARRLAAMEADLKALREQQASLQASMAALTAQLQAERDERAPKSLLYALGAALALVVAALGWLLLERRRERALQVPGEQPWWQSAQNTDGAGAVSLASSAAAADVSAQAPLSAQGSSAATLKDADDNLLASLDVQEATESSFALAHEDAADAADALLDLLQKVEFFESLQQPDEVAALLEEFVQQHPASGELPYLLMMRQAHLRGDDAGLRALERRYQQAFAAPSPDLACYTAGSAPLESQAKFIDVLTRFWPGEQVLGLLTNTLLAPPGTGLLEKHSLQAFEDALLLYSVAHTLHSDTDLSAPPTQADLPQLAASARAAPVLGSAVAASGVSDWAAVTTAAAPSSSVTETATSAPMSVPVPVAPANGLDLDLSFAPDHEVPPPAEAPAPADAAADRRELPMLDFDLFAIENDSPTAQGGQPPEKKA